MEVLEGSYLHWGFGGEVDIPPHRVELARQHAGVWRVQGEVLSRIPQLSLEGLHDLQEFTTANVTSLCPMPFKTTSRGSR